jgi:hypothetical protein
MRSIAAELVEAEWQECLIAARFTALHASTTRDGAGGGGPPIGWMVTVTFCDKLNLGPLLVGDSCLRADAG